MYWYIRVNLLDLKFATSTDSRKTRAWRYRLRRRQRLLQWRLRLCAGPGNGTSVG